jgi:uncharacterized surface protein with fasciclin (FAS1) repeats
MFRFFSASQGITDDAVAKLPAGTLAMLAKMESKRKLTSILTYHVVVGGLKATAVSRIETLSFIHRSAKR